MYFTVRCWTAPRCGQMACAAASVATHARNQPHGIQSVGYFGPACSQVWSLGNPTPNMTLEGHEKGVNCVDYYSGQLPCLSTYRRFKWSMWKVLLSV